MADQLGTYGSGGSSERGAKGLAKTCGWREVMDSRDVSEIELSGLGDWSKGVRVMGIKEDSFLAHQPHFHIIMGILFSNDVQIDMVIHVLT